MYGPYDELSPPSFISLARDRACSLLCYMVGSCALAFREVTTRAEASLTTLILVALRGCTISPLGCLGPSEKRLPGEDRHQLAYAMATNVDFLSGEAGIVTLDLIPNHSFVAHLKHLDRNQTAS